MTQTISKTFEIINQKGLHARASAKFVEVVEQHAANVEVSKDGLSATGDSIMGLLMLAASKGSFINVEISGADADAAAQALETLIVDKFGEEF
ncbi:HPr family phosphocarrier protein [Nereida sp.]|uniref:HPr family phosphocarrier protein n=1 Tax=Nereida sp. TaxID=2736090 RepID=UPI003F69EB98